MATQIKFFLQLKVFPTVCLSLSRRCFSISKTLDYRYYRMLADFKPVRSALGPKRPESYPSMEICISREEQDEMSLDIWKSLQSDSDASKTDATNNKKTESGKN